jgi:adenine-specific DNA methylase
LALFPSTRYQGSKRKIIPWLHEVFSEIEFDSVLDLFGGSASVSYLLKRMGKRVAYNDLLRCNYLTAIALIQNNSVHLEESFKIVKPCPRDAARYNFVRRTFKGYFFTDYENAWIDRAVATLDRLAGPVPLTPYKRAIGYYALFQACLVKRPFNLFHRKNLYLRKANVHRTFGNKTTWERPIGEMFRRFTREANESVFAGKHPCRAHNYDAQEYPHMDYDLVYFDVPYVSWRMKIESADYVTNYHFLEGLSKYNEWPNAVNHESSILALKQGNPNPYASPLTNRTALRALFERFEKSKLVISYKRFGTPSLSWFTSELRRIGKRVNYHTRHYKYALNNQNGDAARNREIIIVAQ